jgi:hypothetical protein
MEKKRCSKCGEVKDSNGFHIDKGNKSGLCAHCKICIGEYNKKRIAKNIELRNKSDFKMVTEIKCHGCGEVKGVSEFYKDKTTKSGFHTRCKICDDEKIDRDKLAKYRKEYRKRNKDKIAKHAKQYYIDNREQLLKQREFYYQNNKDFVDTQKKQYAEDHRDERREQVRQYSKKNEKKLKLQGKKRRNSNAKYELFFDRLTVDESPLLSDDGIFLEVKCRYCGRYFIPTHSAVASRIGALNGNVEGDQYLYCSEYCKQACPVYGQVKYPKGFKHTTSREVNSLVRQMVFERDNWTCQICGKTIKDGQLHCHHMDPVAQNPMFQNDINSCITLCKGCHKMVHSRIGCRYIDLVCKSS